MLDGSAVIKLPPPKAKVEGRSHGIYIPRDLEDRIRRIMEAEGYEKFSPCAAALLEAAVTEWEKAHGLKEEED